MTTAEIEEKITGIFEEAIRQKTVNGVSYAWLTREGVAGTTWARLSRGNSMTWPP